MDGPNIGHNRGPDLENAFAVLNGRTDELISAADDWLRKCPVIGDRDSAEACETFRPHDPPHRGPGDLLRRPLRHWSSDMTDIQIQSDEHWHELRARNIGGSEVAALFGLSSYLTRFELWHRKAGNLPEVDLSDDERVFWGAVLEPAIAMGVGKKKGWNLRKVHRYMEHPAIEGMGASLDYHIVSPDESRGPGALEIKTADWLIFRDWEEGEPPMKYELQLQHQLAVTGWSWGAIAVLVGGNDLHIFERSRHDRTIARIESAVRDFWHSIKAGQEPKPDFATDTATIMALHQTVDEGRIVDLSEDNYARDLIVQYVEAAADEQDAKQRKDAAKGALIKEKLGDAAKALCGPYTISAKAVAESKPKVITADMVGQAIGGRRGYRNFRITEKKAKKEAA